MIHDTAVPVGGPVVRVQGDSAVEVGEGKFQFSGFRTGETSVVKGVAVFGVQFYCGASATIFAVTAYPIMCPMFGKMLLISGPMKPTFLG